MFNLLASPWLPARRQRTGFAWISADQLAPADAGDDPVVALAFPRPDWNAAVTEFLIGVICAAMGPPSAGAWRKAWQSPPTTTQLAEALAPLVARFNGDGEGPLAFQDHAPLAGAEEKDIAQLLIDAPGAITLTKNTDLFIKRDRTPALCLPYAYAALITLQAYAPSGGAGHRTSMRGGGPLTTLVDPPHPPTLWHRLWANVPLATDRPAGWSDDDPRWGKTLPWLAPTLVSDSKQEVGPDSAPHWLAYFACPRRIRLQVEADGACALGGRGDFGIVRAYRTQNYGANYTNWRHPFSPHRPDGKGGFFPVHPNPGSRGYRGWLGIWGETPEDRSLPLREWPNKVSSLGLPRRIEVSAWGYDMDNMKARAWVDDRLPWFAFDDTQQEQQQAWLARAGAAINAASAAAAALGTAVRRMRAGEFVVNGQTGAVQLRVREEATPELSQDAQSLFWAETEGPFRDWLDQLAGDPEDAAQTLVRAWRDSLRRHALALFERTVGSPATIDVGPDTLKRWAVARRDLESNFTNHPKAEVTKLLGITVTDAKPRGRRTAEKEATA